MNAQSHIPDSTNNTTRKLMEWLSYAEQDAVTSKDCLKRGILTDTASKYQQFILDPGGTILKTHLELGAELVRSIEFVIAHFLNSNKSFIYRVAKKPNTLSYYIAFKDDTYELRENFFKFLEVYEELDLAETFPVYFQFVSKRVADKFNPDTEVQLIDGEPLTAS